MVYAPIWKDTNYSTTATSLDYKISVDGVVIYAGRAVKMPNENNLIINLNKICKDYLEQGVQTILDGDDIEQENPLAYRVFTLQNSTGGTLQTYGFLYDWEKGVDWSNNNRVLTLPINGERVAGMFSFRTQYSNGTVITEGNATTLYPKNVCADYGLYYLGLGGGWASFVYTGKCKRVDNITTHQFDHSYNNTTSEFEVGRYVSEVVPTYELNTGILTEEQAERYAKDLIGSNKCYLHNFKTNTIIPVVITENSAEYKREGDEVITYTTRVKESQITIRQ